jgi:hypothetical protein
MEKYHALREIARKTLYAGKEIPWVPPTKRQMDRAFFIIGNKKLPDYVEPVAKYVIEKQSGTVNEIYENLSKSLEENDIKSGLFWLDYHMFIEVMDDRYSTEPHEIELLKEFLGRD